MIRTTVLVLACSIAAWLGAGRLRVAKIDPRERRPLYDSAGNQIGEVTIDGDTDTARIIDPAVVAAIKASAAAGRGISMGYRVTLEALPARPADAEDDGAPEAGCGPRCAPPTEGAR